ncbi:unnamed protein product [Linum tenue]|uniref:Fungal lipase-type domain-containing protein n=2 Tax=Linum tenue TaxID=586396 RepID=A0AAV0R8K0_9ROSI|nr:unnamed protein product [Linum tenue]
MECDKRFSSDYMLLNHEELSLSDLFRLLFSSDVEKRKVVDSKENKEESFERRWLMFVSIVVQKTLQFFSRPLSFVGSCIEMWLGLLSSNGGFGGLLLNVLTGKVVVPDKESATFVSFIGNFDKRTELDKSIERGDPRYNAALAMMAAKASYENPIYIQTIVNNHWQVISTLFHFIHSEYQNKATTQAFLMRDTTQPGEEETIVVSFRGTEPFDADAWCSDFDISWYEFPGVGRVHGGFMKALGLQKSLGWPKTLQQQGDRPLFAYYKIREMLTEIMSQNEKAKFFVAGHSLGGALATLFPAVLMLHDEDVLLKRLEGVYTFGQPRVGDEKFGKYMKRKLDEYGIGYYRFVYGFDIVPRLPYDDANLMFKHFGTCIFFNRNYHGQVVVEEPYKNYFSPGGTVGMIWNALMELTRSFTIAIDHGEEYSEGWLLTGVRLVGLLIPGLPAHLPRDYVNCTRLGPPHLLHSS